MKVTVESRGIVRLASGLVRLWEGHTAAGVPVEMYTIAVGVNGPDDHDLSEFESMDHELVIDIPAARPMHTAN